MHPYVWNAIAGAVFALIVLLAYRFLKKRDDDQHSPISFDDLVMSASTDKVRRVSTEKVLLIASWIVTTWGLIYMIGADKVTDAIYLGYGAIWITPIIAHMFAASPPPAPPSA